MANAGFEIGTSSVLELDNQQVVFWVKNSTGKVRTFTTNKLKYDNHLEFVSALRTMACEIEIYGNS